MLNEYNNLYYINIMIASYTQTYSDDRKELFDFHNKDEKDIYFRKKMDKNYYVFHNCSEKYKNVISNYDYFQFKPEFISYDNISYTHSFMNTLYKCKKDGVKYLFFLQDDVFCLQNETIIDELLNFIKNNTFDMLQIESCDFKGDTIYSNENLKIYNTTSDDYVNYGSWAYDDSPYVANIDFLINKLYDITFIKLNDVWRAEIYLANKVKHDKIQRLTSNLSIFRRFVLVGRNQNRKDELPNLIKL
jgi:hypothetical protein